MARRKLVVVAESFGEYLPCSLQVFTINGICADKDDFGETEDLDSENAEQYCCSNRQFVPKMPTDKVLKKYKINLKEYSEICDILGCNLSVGSCGMCV